MKLTKFKLNTAYMARFIKLNIFILLLSVTLISCSDDATGKWIDAENGIKVFVPIDFKDKYDISSLKCDASYFEYDGMKVYSPPFKISVTDKTGQKIQFYSLIPSLIPNDELKVKEHGKGNVYWIIAGNRDGKYTDGYTFEYRVQDDSVITKYEYGDFKKDNLIKGYRMRYFPKDNHYTITYGHFKNDELFEGVKQKIFGDSIGEKILGIWEEDGKFNPTYLSLSQMNYAIYAQKGYTPEQVAEANATFTQRYYFWLKYKWWFFIGFSVVAILVLCIGIGESDIGTKRADHDICSSIYRIRPWSVKGAYMRWFLFAPFGTVLCYFKEIGLFIIWTILVWTIIIASSKFFILYGLEPEMWVYLLNYASKFWQFEAFIYFCLPIWLVVGIAIPYKVYTLNFRFYRHNIYESYIKKGISLKFEALYKRIPQILSNDQPRIESLYNEAIGVYDQELGTLSKAFSFITNSKVSHARDKAMALNSIYSEFTSIALNHQKITDEMLNYLEIERKNAYRNMMLAKELVRIARSMKSKKQIYRNDKIKRINIDRPTDIHSGAESIAGVDYNRSFSFAFESFDNTFSMMKEWGVDDKNSLLISAGVGAIEYAVDSVCQINERRTLEREYYESVAASIVRSFKDTRAKLLVNHGKILSANELMIALGRTNVAFVKAYTPLRDYVFGTDSSFSGFLKHTFRRNKYNRDVFDDIAYLLEICSEYNKINKRKV